MRQCQIGRHALPRYSRLGCGPSALGKLGKSWYVDETYIKVKGTWCCLYRAIDRDGNLVDSMLNQKRDMTAVTAFVKQAVAVAEQPSERVTTDGHDSYPRAIREVLGADVQHRVSDCLTNRIEPRANA